MQRQDWNQVFEEVERQFHDLLVERQVQIEQAFKKSASKLSIAFSVGLEEKDAGFDVDVDINFVLERVKAGGHKRLILGQIDLPGVERSPEPPPRPQGVVRRLGPAPKLLEGGEPFAMGAGEGDEASSCATCRNNDGGGGGCHVGGVECGPALKFYAPPEEVDAGEPEDFDELPDHDDHPGFAEANPFVLDANGTEVVDAKSRLERLKGFDAEQLRKVLDLRGCQRSVVKAAERRLRKLEKGPAKTCANCLHGEETANEFVCHSAVRCSVRDHSAWSARSAA